MRNPFYILDNLEDVLKRNEQDAAWRRTFPRVLPQVERRSRKPLAHFRTGLIQCPQSVHEQPGTIVHHDQIELDFLSQERKPRIPMSVSPPEGQALIPNWLCYVLMNVRESDRIFDHVYDAYVDSQPDVMEKKAAWEEARRALQALKHAIETRCVEIEPSFPQMIEATEKLERYQDESGKRWKKKPSELQLDLREERRRIEAIRRKARSGLEQEVRQAEERLRETTRALHSARRVHWKTFGNLRTALLEVLHENGVYYFENEDGLVKKIVEGIRENTFSLYRLKPQSESRVKLDRQGVPLDSLYKSLEIPIEAIYDAVSEKNMNRARKPGAGYFAYAPNRARSSEQYLNYQGPCFVGRTIGAEGGYGVILPLDVWRAVVKSAEVLCHPNWNLPAYVFAHIGRPSSYTLIEDDEPDEMKEDELPEESEETKSSTPEPEAGSGGATSPPVLGDPNGTNASAQEAAAADAVN